MKPDQGYCYNATDKSLTPGPCVGYFQIVNDSVIASAKSCDIRVWKLRCESKCPSGTFVNGSAQSQCKSSCNYKCDDDQILETTDLSRHEFYYSSANESFCYKQCSQMILANNSDTIVFVLTSEGNLQCILLSGNQSCIDYKYNYVQDLSFFDSN